MNNACFGTFRSLPLLTPRPCRALARSLRSADGLFSYLSPGSSNAPARRSISSCSSSLGGFIYRQSRPARDVHTQDRTFCTPRRNIHTSISCLARAARPPPPPRHAVPVQGARKAPIPFGNIGKKALDRIFEHDVNYEEGNKILQVLHTRRVTGALVDQGLQITAFPHTVPAESLVKALAWLRTKFPVDEQAAADAWAEQEAARLEQTYIARAEKLGLYKPLDADEQPGRASTKSVYGDNSVLDDFKRHHEQRRAREKKEKDESGETQRTQTMALAKREERERAQEVRLKVIAERQEARALKGMITPEEAEVPEMTAAKRLSASTALAAGLIGIFLALGLNYTPPALDKRLFPDIPPAMVTVGGIVAINALIYILWKVPPLWRTLNTYFMQVPSAPVSWSVILNTVSHQRLLHLATNMAGLVFYGVTLHEDIGRGNWLAIYLAGGVFGSICSLWGQVLTKSFHVYTLGASGSVWAIMAAWAYLAKGKPQAPTDTWEFSLDVARWSALIFQVLTHFAPGILSKIDVASHVGGAALGLAAAAWLKKTKDRRKDSGDAKSGQVTAEKVL